jgi:hypothetical protein
MATNNAINLSAQGVAYYNGTGTFSAPTITLHGTVIGAASNNIASLGVATNGQLVIGSTGADPVLAALTPGTGITITNGAGTITIASTGGGFTWTDVTGATQALLAQNGYVTDHTNVTYTLPASGALGDIIKIVGKLGITTIAQNANQQILIGSASSTVGVGGSVAGTNVGDCIELICITAGASTVWRSDSLIGNWTVT